MVLYGSYVSAYFWKSLWMKLQSVTIQMNDTEQYLQWLQYLLFITHVPIIFWFSIYTEF